MYNEAFKTFNPQGRLDTSNAATNHKEADSCVIELESFTDYELEIHVPLVEGDVPEQLSDKERAL